MTKSKLQFKRTITDQLTVKGGKLSEDCSHIKYIDNDNAEQEVKISDLLNPFKNQTIDFSVSLKTDENLNVVTDDEE